MRELLRTLVEKVKPARTALLVIDMQNDLCSPVGAFARMGLDVSRMEAVAQPIAQLVEKARQAGVLIVFTQVVDTVPWAVSDAYYEANLSFYEANRGKEAQDDGSARWADPGFGLDFFAPAAPLPADIVVVKHRFGGFWSTKLDQILRSNNIRTVIGAGVMTEVCVESTLREALDRDYYIVVAEDCTDTLSLEAKQASLKTLGGFFGLVTTSDQIFKAWGC